MKRCPQCDFTFEGDEQFCDFDHSKLVAIADKPNAVKLLSLDTSAAARFRRLMKSRGVLAGLSATAVAASALTIGYYDALKQSEAGAAAPTADQRIQDFPQSTASRPRQKPDQAFISPSTKPKRISTLRKIAAHANASDMPSSILKYRADGERSSRSRERLSTAQYAPRVDRPTAATRAALRSHTTKPTRSTSARAARQSSAVARLNPEAGKPRVQIKRSSTTEKAQRPDGKNRFFAILKKTGSILTKPFRL